MPTRWDAIVVGAGISGLAAAHELARRQRRVLVLEAAGVGAAQSAGLARIFRVAHADPRLCALALEAMRGWRRWESELGTGRLLGGEGLVVAGSERAASYRAAMNAAGAPSAPLDRAAVAARLPLLAPDHPWDGGLWDPLAGSLRIRRALAALARRVTVRRATVVAVEPEGAVRLDDGSTPAAAAVVVCAGLATGPLVAPLGLDVGVDARHHVRLTYQMRPPVATACLIAPEAYALPLGSTGRFAVGMRDEDGGWPLGAIGDDEAATAVRRQHATWVPRAFPGLAAEPVGDVRCVSLEADWIGPAGDGFVAERSGPVIAFGASNVMKFGPLVGERLAAMALGDDRGVHPDVR